MGGGAGGACTAFVVAVAAAVELIPTYLEASEVRDTRPADQVGDGLARVLDGPHQLLKVLFKQISQPRGGGEWSLEEGGRQEMGEREEGRR